MNRVSLGVSLAILVAAGVVKAQVDPVRQQIEILEAQVGKAIATNDQVTLKKLCSPKMLVNSPADRVLTRDEIIEALGKGQLKYSRYENRPERFETYGDVAVLMGQETVVRADGSYGGQALTRRYTDVWQRSGDSWVQIARQATYTSGDKE